MATTGGEYELEGPGAGDVVETLALAPLRVEPGPWRTEEETLYETFDRRLARAGWLLRHAGGELALLERDTRAERASARLPRPERLRTADLPPGRLRDELEALVEPRALIAVARTRTRRRALRVLDDEEKTVVRLELDRSELLLDGDDGGREPLPARLRVLGVRGYQQPLRRVRRAVERDLGLAPAPAPLHEEAMARSPAAPPAPPAAPTLAPGDRAAAAATAVARPELATIEATLPGVLADVDTEYLHDLRVAVRRTRALQRELEPALGAADVAPFRAAFRRLQAATGPTRDLDVALLELEELRHALPGVPPTDLDPLASVLADRRRDERARMVRVLRSPATNQALADWRAFLDRVAAGDGSGAGAAGDDGAGAAAIAAVAGPRIATIHRAMVRAGRAIDDTSPPEALHELRKQGKELRYLLEMFAVLFPRDAVAPLVRRLKGLQTTLGRHQDVDVQVAMLRSLAGEVAGREGGPGAVLAMGRLIDRLEAERALARADFAARFAAFAARPQRTLVERTFRP
jgi:CHAD domain-containing protein